MQRNGESRGRRIPTFRAVGNRLQCFGCGELYEIMLPEDESPFRSTDPGIRAFRQAHSRCRFRQPLWAELNLPEYARHPTRIEPEEDPDPGH